MKLVAGYELPPEELRKWCDSKMPSKERDSLYSAMVGYMLRNPDGLPLGHFKFAVVCWPPAYLNYRRKIRNPNTQVHYVFITRYLVDKALPRQSPWNGEYQAKEGDQDRLLKATLVKALDLPEDQLTFATYAMGNLHVPPKSQWEQITIPQPQAPDSTLARSD